MTTTITSFNIIHITNHNNIKIWHITSSRKLLNTKWLELHHTLYIKEMSYINDIEKYASYLFVVYICNTRSQIINSREKDTHDEVYAWYGYLPIRHKSRSKETDERSIIHMGMYHQLACHIYLKASCLQNRQEETWALVCLQRRRSIIAHSME